MAFGTLVDISHFHTGFKVLIYNPEKSLLTGVTFKNNIKYMAYLKTLVFVYIMHKAVCITALLLIGEIQEWAHSPFVTINACLPLVQPLFIIFTRRYHRYLPAL